MRLTSRPALVALLVIGAFIFAACPRPNGYTVGPTHQQLRFDQMVGLYPIPGDEPNAVLLTKDGLIRRANLADDRIAATIFMDIKDRVITPQAGEEGLLGLAFAPDYSSSREFYVYYSVGNPRRTRLSRFVSQGERADPATEQILLEIDQPYDNHNGGGLTFGADGMLYVGVGDGGSSGDPHRNGQNLDTLLGKILRIDVSGDGAYAIPADNPFVGRPGRDEIYAYGFRNPWRLTRDRVTGELWAGDVGQNRWEEVNRVVAGGNYGWNILEGSHCYGASGACDATGTILPREEYEHIFGCSVTGGYVYRGSAMPELQGWYVYGDYCTGRVWAVDTRGNGPAIPLADTGRSITSFGEDHAGELYLVTFDRQVVRLVRK